MAVLLYKKGKSATIRGVECDFVRVEIRQIKEYMADGWCSSLNDLNEDDPIELNDKPTELTNKEIRELAEKLGIENFINKNIGTLKAEIEALNDDNE